jgi:hypothetical protein
MNPQGKPHQPTRTQNRRSPARRLLAPPRHDTSGRLAPSSGTRRVLNAADQDGRATVVVACRHVVLQTKCRTPVPSTPGSPAAPRIVLRNTVVWSCHSVHPPGSIRRTQACDGQRRECARTAKPLPGQPRGSRSGRSRVTVTRFAMRNPGSFRPSALREQVPEFEV